MTDSYDEQCEMSEVLGRLGTVLGRLPGFYTPVDTRPPADYGADLPTRGESMADSSGPRPSPNDRAARVETRLAVIVQWHTRSVHEAAAAKSSLDMRDWEMWEGSVQDRTTIGELAAVTGLSHAALYKALRRGSTFREPPLPF